MKPHMVPCKYSKYVIVDSYENTGILAHFSVQTGNNAILEFFQTEIRNTEIIVWPIMTTSIILGTCTLQ